jgi:hypothetical protein
MVLIPLPQDVADWLADSALVSDFWEHRLHNLRSEPLCDAYCVSTLFIQIILTSHSISYYWQYVLYRIMCMHLYPILNSQCTAIHVIISPKLKPSIRGYMHYKVQIKSFFQRDLR